MDKQIIDDYDSQIKIIQEMENLICISDNQYNHYELNLANFPSSKSNDSEFNDLLNFFDIVKCSEDLKYFISLLYIYKEFINNPLEEVFNFYGRKISTYSQNLYDRRYSILVSCCFEKCYNYWDRIGDKIWSFFPELLKERDVDFVRIINLLESKNINNENLEWLINFKNIHYSEINNGRKQIVHYSQYEAKYRYEHIIATNDFQKINEIWNEKKSFPIFFKNHLNYCVNGCYHTFKFLTCMNID